MKNILFDGNSKVGNFAFKQLLSGLEGSLRYHFNNPEKLVKAAGVKPGQTVLEIGCGSGFFTPAAASMVGDDGVLHSIDLHPAAVAETSKKVNELGLTNVTVTQANAEDTHLADASFDLILLYGVIPAPGVISLERLTREIHRLLKPGGTLAVWTLVPFWSPKSIAKTNRFTYLKKDNGVHRFERIG
jgi:demethylmenaquinone methyltransferase/2-methoxy-6-polyprenyl-1,4-benzoquinol methylase